MIVGLLMNLSWTAYFAVFYRERSQRRNPCSLWAISLWTAAITAASAVASAIQFLLFVAANREGFATGHAIWARSPLLSFGPIYINMALWIALIVLLVHDPRGQRTRRVAAVLAAVALLGGLLEAYDLVLREAHNWAQMFARSWRIYPFTALSLLVLAPSLSIFHSVCMVLFPFAVWKEIGPRVPHSEAAPEQPAVE
jgi:hypothetical protein